MIKLPFRRRAVVTPEVPAPLDRAAARRMADRAERRRIKHQQFISRMCHRCGFGAVKGVPNSNLVRVKDEEGNDAWGHASPTVCAGFVMAITNSARENVRQAFADFLRITWTRTQKWFHSQTDVFKKFWRTEESR